MLQVSLPELLMSSIEIVLFVEAAIAMLQERLNSLAMCSIEKDTLIWMTLILIQFSKILHQEIPEDGFYKN